jgi:hypothetical protein
VFNESAMFTLDLSTNSTNQNSEIVSVQVEHVDDDVVVAAPPSTRNSSLFRHSSPVVQPLHHELEDI